jgi:hypothetical protein
LQLEDKSKVFYVYAIKAYRGIINITLPILYPRGRWVMNFMFTLEKTMVSID